METTLILDDAVVRELREEAARRGTTLSALVETAVRRILTERPTPETETEPDELPPLPSWNLGKPLVDVADREALDEVIDAERPAPKMEADELPPLPTWSGEALVDVADREALYEAIDAERDLRLYGKRAYR